MSPSRHHRCPLVSHLARPPDLHLQPRGEELRPSNLHLQLPCREGRSSGHRIRPPHVPTELDLEGGEACAASPDMTTPWPDPASSCAGRARGRAMRHCCQIRPRWVRSSLPVHHHQWICRCWGWIRPPYMLVEFAREGKGQRGLHHYCQRSRGEGGARALPSLVGERRGRSHHRWGRGRAPVEEVGI
jgi:hypothetical protein